MVASDRAHHDEQPLVWSPVFLADRVDRWLHPAIHAQLLKLAYRLERMLYINIHNYVGLLNVHQC